MEYLTLMVMLYLSVALAKFVLTAPHICMAVGAASRLAGASRGTVVPTLAALVPFAVVAIVLLTWPFLLYREGLRFFVMYSDFSVLRDLVATHRSLRGES